MSSASAGQSEPRAGAKRWRWWRVCGAAAVAAACLGLVISQVTLANVKATFSQIHPGMAAAGLLVAVASYALKALRFRILLGRGAPFDKLLGVTVAQNVIAQLVPARAGDVGYLVMLKKMGMASVGLGLVSLVVCRMADTVILGTMYLVSLLMLELKEPLQEIAYAVGGLVGLGIALTAALVIFRTRAAAATERALEATRLLRLKWVRYLWDELRQALPGLSRLKPLRHVAPMLLLSLLIWAATAGWIYLIWRAVNAPLGAAQLVFIFSFAYVLGLLPLFFFGGIGTVDAVNALVLMSFGISRAQAASFTLCNRVLAVVYQVALVLLALALLGGSLRLAPRKPNPREAAGG